MPASDTLSDFAREAVLDAVEDLTPIERTVIEARMWEQIGWTAIERREGISRAVIRDHYNRALKKLHDALQ